MIPRPRRTVHGTGGITLDQVTTVAAAAGLDSVEQYLQATLRPSTGLPVPRALTADQATIRLRLVGPGDAQLPAGPDGDRSEAFRLVVTAEHIEVVGGGAAGVFYGVQALLQLLPAAALRRGRISSGPWYVGAVVVEDAPAFAWRGVMLDVARHFRTKSEVLRVIDQAATYRLNRLHLHLTDDQGWRIEIPRYPLLTEIGAWRRESQLGAHVPDADGTLRPAGFDNRPHGGYYTQDDLREIVAYAADRFVTVVPEIETPGHVRAALAAYPHLGVTGQQVDVWAEWGICEDVLNSEESTVEFFQHILDDVMALFPSPYIGIGGDECPKDQWQADARTQERMRQLGLADGEQLQAWLVGRFAAHVQAAGQRAFGWDEILEGGTLPPSTTILSWRGLHGAVAAARRRHDVISSPDDQVYLNYRESDLDTEPIPVAIVLTTADVFSFDPVPTELSADQRRHVIGGQANAWTEHIDSARTLDYLLFPRLLALAEALWSADTAGARDYADFAGRLHSHLPRLEAMDIEYRPSAGPRPWQQRPGVPGRPSTREILSSHNELITANIAG
ncbi:beta-N-acetylhexosaminidase [Actinoplanes xinjiangensis]|uniref:beta-N-acetylhexosaminidase n=1 Tax=Actinoplanes xinjiangensis TaxID=512350 RepID=UPI0034137135